MITCENFTHEGWREYVLEMAERAFTEHVITRETENRWHCGKPGTEVFHFRVCFGPASIHLYGDIHDLVLHPWGGFSHHWLIGVFHPDRNDARISNSEYIMEKVPLGHKQFEQVFLLKEALAYIETDRKEAQEAQDEKWLETIDHLEERFLDEYGVTEDQRGECGASVAWCQAYSEAYPDVDGIDTPYDWNSAVLTQLVALKTFVRLYLEHKKNEKPQEDTPPQDRTAS